MASLGSTPTPVWGSGRTLPKAQRGGRGSSSERKEGTLTKEGDGWTLDGGGTQSDNTMFFSS